MLVSQLLLLFKIATICSTKLYQELAHAARPLNGSQGGYVDSTQVGGTGEKIAFYFKTATFSPTKHTTALPYAQDGKYSSSDLESQSGSSGNGVNGPNEQRHPYASPRATASGLPAILSDPVPSSPTSPPSGHYSNNQKIAIAVERSTEIKSEVIPRDVNFVQQHRKEAEPYSGLKRQSS